jgi:hypothetical protein
MGCLTRLINLVVFKHKTSATQFWWTRIFGRLVTEGPGCWCVTEQARNNGMGACPSQFFGLSAPMTRPPEIDKGVVDNHVIPLRFC